MPGKMISLFNQLINRETRCMCAEIVCGRACAIIQVQINVDDDVSLID